MPELKALARGHRLRGYSRLRKAELIGVRSPSRKTSSILLYVI